MYVYMSMHWCMHLILDPLGDQKRALDPMEQKLQADVCGLMVL